MNSYTILFTASSLFGLLMFLLMVSTSIIRFGIVNSILFDLFGLDFGSMNIFIEFLVSIAVAVGADSVFRRTIDRYRKQTNLDHNLKN